MAEALAEPKPLRREDFVSHQDVRWCPGCGDYAILAQMQRMMPDLGIPRENIVFISGIGCSSRFPYYMNTYGIHSIHGRAPTLATGLKAANPDLSVWVVTGDGDGLSIGGNHLLHCLRRNVDINIILFNNRIYGLTKGQYSPTSLPGTKSKTSPFGSIEQSFNPLCVAIGAEATFVARTVDRNTKHLSATLQRAAAHKGTSFVEVYQNCNIFNDGAYLHLTDADVKDDHTLLLEHGQPMIFGKDSDKGIRLKGLDPEMVTLGNGVTEDELLVHDETADQASLAYMLSRMEHPRQPVPLGVFRCIFKPTYEEQLLAQESALVEERGEGDLATLYHSADTWEVGAEGVDTVAGRDTRDLAEMSLAEGTPMVPGVAHELEPASRFQDLVTAPISRVTLRKAVCISADSTVADSIDLMLQEKIGYVLVTDEDGKLVGLFAEGDVFYRVAGSDLDITKVTVGSLMAPDPIVLPDTAPIAYALHLMDLHGYRHIPIVDDDDRPLGIVSFRVALKFVDDLYAEEN